MLMTAKNTPRVYPGCGQLYAFDILGMLVYNMNDPEKHSQLTNSIYKALNAEFAITKFCEFGTSTLTVEFGKDDNIANTDIDQKFRDIVASCIFTQFSYELAKIPGLGTMGCGEVKDLIARSIIILNMSSGSNCMFHIEFRL